jgi:group I intron endonuclease
MFRIYGLKLKNSDGVYYVGRTSKSLEERLKLHLRSIKYDNRKTHRHHWIKKHYDNIEIVLIEDGIETFEESCIKEVEYIKEYREIYNLVNLTDGGEGGCPGYKHTEEAKKKISKVHKGKVYSEEVRQKMRKPKNISDEQREKKIELYKIKFKGEGNPMWGRKRPDTALRNKQMAGFKHTDESKEKMSQQRVGEKHPNCRLSREGALICIKMKRVGYSIKEISELFNMKEGYIKNLVFLGYKRKDIDYENLENILSEVVI